MREREREDALLEHVRFQEELPSMFLLYPGCEVTIGELLTLRNSPGRKFRRYRRGKIVQNCDRYIIVSFKHYLECFNKQSILCGDIDLVPHIG